MDENVTVTVENNCLVFENMVIPMDNINGITRGENDDAVIWVSTSEEPFAPGTDFEVTVKLFLENLSR